jgi:hypothetical protein
LRKMAVEPQELRFEKITVEVSVVWDAESGDVFHAKGFDLLVLGCGKR